MTDELIKLEWVTMQDPYQVTYEFCFSKWFLNLQNWSVYLINVANNGKTNGKTHLSFKYDNNDWLLKVIMLAGYPGYAPQNEKDEGKGSFISTIELKCLKKDFVCFLTYITTILSMQWYLDSKLQRLSGEHWLFMIIWHNCVWYDISPDQDSNQNYYNNRQASRIERCRLS